MVPVSLAKEIEDPKDLKNIGVTKEHVEPISSKAYVLTFSKITGMTRELEFYFGFWENRISNLHFCALTAIISDSSS